MPTVRINLAGPVAITGPSGAVVLEAHFPSRQARRAFAYLVHMGTSGATSDELAAGVWPADPPPAWRSGVAALVSKLRLLFATRLDGAIGVESDFGVYRLHTADGTWVDLDAAQMAAERGIAALKAGRLEDAGASLTIACSITMRPFLTGDEGDWIESVRNQLLQTRIRALESLAEVHMATDSFEEAAGWAETVLKLDPYRDRAYLVLMRALAGAGNP
ncbi:MAG: AfsR/SARP family transcriptional regulator, partial [Tepidiformaceae bacterium]